MLSSNIKIWTHTLFYSNLVPGRSDGHTKEVNLQFPWKVCLKNLEKSCSYSESYHIWCTLLHTVWFCHWSTQSHQLRYRRSLTKQAHPEDVEKLLWTPETKPELIDPYSLLRQASSYVDGWGLNGKKGSNFSPGLCSCQKIGFDWQLSGAQLLQLGKRQAEK